MKNLFLTTLMCLFAAVSSFAKEGQLTVSINWELNDNTLLIAGAGKMPEYESPKDFPWHESRASIITVIITNQITNISGYAFSDCLNLQYIGMPNSIMSIGCEAFSNCITLDKITIPKNVTNIENSAFSGCTAINTITIPKNVTNIGDSVFLNCKLTTIIMEGEVPPTITAETFASIDRSIRLIVPDNSVKLYNESAYWNEFTSLQVYSNIIASGTTGTLTWSLANGIMTISGEGEMPDYYDFLEWKIYSEYISKLIIEEGVTSIGAYAFADFMNSTSVELPSTLRAIGIKAFSFWASLEEIVIPDGVTSIGGAAFGNCYGLEKITIPNSVTSIEWDVFNNCISLHTIIANCEVPPAIFDSTFDGVDHSITVIVPKAAIEEYRSAPYWKEFTSFQAQTPSSIKEVGVLQNIYVEGGCIIVSEGIDAEMSVINLNGHIIAKGYQLTRIEVPQAGIYLIKIGSKVTKILVNK